MIPDYDRKQALVWLRTHAEIIESLITSEWTDEKDNTRIWRALYWADDHMVAAAIFQIKGGQPPLFIQAQIRHNSGMDIAPATQQLNGPNMTPTEMAVFLGLDAVDPTAFEWRPQQFRNSIIHVVREGLPGLKRH